MNLTLNDDFLGVSEPVSSYCILWRKFALFLFLLSYSFWYSFFIISIWLFCLLQILLLMHFYFFIHIFHLYFYFILLLRHLTNIYLHTNFQLFNNQILFYRFLSSYILKNYVFFCKIHSLFIGNQKSLISTNYFYLMLFYQNFKLKSKRSLDKFSRPYKIDFYSFKKILSLALKLKKLILISIWDYLLIIIQLKDFRWKF